MTTKQPNMIKKPVVKGVTYFLAHVPSMIRHGSKLVREIDTNPNLLSKVLDHLNPFEKAVSYAPNQVYIGNLDPDDLHTVAAPWWKNEVPDADRNGPFGEIMPEEEFYGVMKMCDEFDLLLFEEDYLEKAITLLKVHPLITEQDIAKIQGKGVSGKEIQKTINDQEALPLYINSDQLIGCCQKAHEQDFNLIPDILLENIVNRASGVMALRHLTSKHTPAEKLEYLIGCGEEAVGDRYNRGGGNMAKAIGELCGCDNATGSDTKAFCCAPVHATVMASSLVASNIVKNAAVVAGGCTAKLGMKYAGHLKHGMPILEDVIGGIAAWISEDDGVSPVVRLDSVGKHTISSGSSQQAIFQKLVIEPLERLGLKMTDIDKYATEMHNPEITEPQGNGDVPKTNYRVVGSFAALRKEIDRNQIDEFIKKRGMLGFSPTQGHIASAVPVLGHAVRSIQSGKIDNTLFFAKGSLFLGRMTQLSDGISFLLDKNNGGS